MVLTMRPTLAVLLLTPTGRLRRRVFWGTSLALWIVLFGAWWAIEAGFGSTLAWLANLPFLWMLAMLAIKRLHDRDRSGFWLLLLLIPLAGPVIVGFCLAFLRGTRGTNRYGDDPRAARRDYHTVG